MNIDLFETGALQAARAISAERIKFIVELVAKGMAAEERRRLHYKRLLSILAELDDEEIALLLAHAKSNSESLSPSGTDRDLWEESQAMWDAAHNKLERLQLLTFKETMRELRLPRDSDGRSTAHVPERDSWGKKEGRFEVTSLGKLLLDAAGLLQKDRRATLDDFIQGAVSNDG